MKAIYSFCQQVYTVEADNLEALQEAMSDGIDETLNDMATNDDGYAIEMNRLDEIGPIAYLLGMGSTVTIIP